MYKLKLIEPADALNTHSKKPTYRYIICNGHNTITGYRCGSKKEVTEFARTTADNLNKKYPRSSKAFVKPVFINVSYV